MSKITHINDHIYIDQGQLLGKGSTGNVYRGNSDKYLEKSYAVKAIDLSEVTNQVTQYLLSCQIAALSELSKLDLKSIVKLQEIGFNSRYCFLAMELLEGGPLSQYIKSNPEGVQEEQVLHLFKQIIQGYRAIKNIGIVHRDIKPDNLIFRQKSHPKSHQQNSKSICFIDFGYCTKQNVPNRPKAYYNVGSPKYMSPQAYRQNVYSEKSDIWALGVILYEMLHGQTIDSGMQMNEYIDFMRNNPIPIRKNISQASKKMLLGMLTFDFRKRISCQAIQQILNPVYLINPKIKNHLNQSEIVPQLRISQNRRQSQFYRSQIFHSDRSHPQNSLNIPMNQIDPRRQERNLSHENRYQEYHHSPKKMIHVEHHSQKISQNVIVRKSVDNNTNDYGYTFNGQFRKIKFNNVQPYNSENQMNRLQRISEVQNDHDTIRFSQINKRHFLNNATRIQDKRSFLRVDPQGPQFHQNSHFQHSQQPAQNLQPVQYSQQPVQHSQQPAQYSQQPGQVQSSHPGQNNIHMSNIRIINENNFPISPPSPIKQKVAQIQVFKSQIFQSQPQANSGNKRNSVFYASQINDIPIKEINFVTSDRVIKNNESLSPYGNEGFNSRNLNKSYSTNVFERTSDKKENSASQHPLLFTQVKQRLLNVPSNPQLRPIDMIINEKNTSNQRAFLRNTMPSVYCSVIQNPVQSNVSNIKPQPNAQFLNYPMTLHPTFIQNSRTQTKRHAPYFDTGYNYKKKAPQHSFIQVSQFSPDNPINRQQNRHQRSQSFKNIPQIGFNAGNNNFYRPANGQEYQLNRPNQNNQQQHHILMGRINEHLFNRNQQGLSKFISFTHKNNQNNQNIQAVNIQNVHPVNKVLRENIMQVNFHKENRFHEPQVQKNYVITPQPVKQTRIPTFIVNNQVKSQQMNPIPNGTGLTYQQGRPTIRKGQQYQSPSQNQLVSIKAGLNQPVNFGSMPQNQNVFRQIHQTVPFYNTPLKDRAH